MAPWNRYYILSTNATGRLRGFLNVFLQMEKLPIFSFSDALLCITIYFRLELTFWLVPGSQKNVLNQCLLRATFLPVVTCYKLWKTFFSGRFRLLAISNKSMHVLWTENISYSRQFQNIFYGAVFKHIEKENIGPVSRSMTSRPIRRLGYMFQCSFLKLTFISNLLYFFHK